MNFKFYFLRFAFKKKLFLPFAFACFLQALSCNIINPAEPIPAYVHIDSFSVFTDAATQGSNSSNITDAWVYVDGTIIGAFQLPATIPVLQSGSHTLTIHPGILIDGIASTRTSYPYYTAFDTIVNFESRQTIHAFPKVTYIPSANLTHIEDFDHLLNLKVTANSDTTITAVQDANSLEGKSGAVFLDDAHSYFECAWKDSFLLPLGKPVYVELNYKTTDEFTVGITAYTSSGIYTEDIVVFRASTAWKKQYINLQPVIENSISATGYKIYIKASKNASFSTASLYFDNIKIVY
jgi:hypothetical protein